MTNRLEIFNELCILCASYHLITLTDYTGDADLQYKIGWSLIAITVFNMTVNIIVMLTISIKNMFVLFKKLRIKFLVFVHNRGMKKL